LNTWFAGSEAGNAIADVLFGDENLLVNWLLHFLEVGQIPIYYSQKYRYPVIQKENLKIQI
jgi:beta-glucosidase